MNFISHESLKQDFASIVRAKETEKLEANFINGVASWIDYSYPEGFQHVKPIRLGRPETMGRFIWQSGNTRYKTDLPLLDASNSNSNGYMYFNSAKYQKASVEWNFMNYNIKIILMRK